MSTTRQTLSIFWRYTRRHKPYFWTGTIGAAFGVIFQDILPPFIVARTFVVLQSGIANGEQLEFSRFTPYIVAYILTSTFGAIAWRVQSFYVWKYELLVRREMITDIYDHLQHQSQRFHADRFGGSLVSQSNKFVSGYERLMDEFTWSIVTGLTALVASIFVLTFASYKFAIVMLVVTITYMVVMYRRMSRQMPFNHAEAEYESKQTGALADAIANVATIRAFANEDYEYKRFRKAADRLYEKSSRLSWEVFKTESLSNGMNLSFNIIAFVFGLLAVTRLGTDVSVLYLVISYTSNIVGRLWQFGRVVRNINRSFGDSAEMTEILGIEADVTDAEKPARARMNRGEVVFSGVTFRYPENRRKPLFKDLSFKLKPGEKIGLIGHSGGGKTTVTKLLLRFMDIDKGTIAIDGQDITSITQADLRKHIAYVAQEPVLFHRSLMENIRYGQRDASDEAVIATAKLANAHDFIASLPQGYDTMVGERGVKLSGGQRQRVAIARAMLKNAPILVLDEATSALDSESEALIQDALWKLMEGRTAIVIAHRLSTIQRMDRIIVLDGGRIVEQGSHKELIHAGGVYADLWNRQSGGFMED